MFSMSHLNAAPEIVIPQYATQRKPLTKWLTMSPTRAIPTHVCEDVHFKEENHKDKDAEPTEFEESVGQALFDLEDTYKELKTDLKDLYINSAIQIDVLANGKGVVIHVPYRMQIEESFLEDSC